MLYWCIGELYVVMVRVVLSSSLHPWDNWVPPDVHGFFWWVFDSLEVLNGFLKQVVVSRKDIGIRKWMMWLRENLSSGPYAWLGPDFVPPSPFLLTVPPETHSDLIPWAQKIEFESCK